MKTTTVICNKCGKAFEKPNNEYNRRIKKNKLMYCSLACAAIIKPLFGGKPNRKPPIKGRTSQPFSYYLRNCRRRNSDFNLDSDFLQKLWNDQKGLCALSKLPLKLNTSTKYKNDYRYTASIDRIDKNKGYTKDNVQFISLSLNLMKNTLTQEQTISFLHEICKNIMS